ncbi:DUF2061 domain-containing protein [Stagnimonas aquatica]|uniref:DUF2061 domain-containing protein n=1 Tax=Stagnimonas aquatica TaxID=2689987 RepID=A0A3N0VE03_9GAMM|nr:DUF2061 domain-containing protein [Stagnimonas aquatica]ROH91007.1 DUF2061 domain-containing protein [Stagnimonas aquatica]
MKKTLSFALLHFGIAFSVTYAFTGSLVAGGMSALVEPFLNTLAAHFHDRYWSRREQRHAGLALS